MFFSDNSAKLFKTLDMIIDRSGADDTAAGKRHFGLTGPSQQSSGDVERQSFKGVSFA
jgi:hypothetical protein